MAGLFRLPTRTTRWRIAGAKLPACLTEGWTGPAADPEGLLRADLLIAEGRIAALTPADAAPPDPALPVWQNPGLVMPCFVDAHTHLDKGHIWPRAQNPDGSVMGARTAVPLDRAAHWTAADVEARMSFGLQAAYAYGTRAIRTHLDCVGAQTRVSWPVFARLREAWRGRIDLQASPLFGAELILEPEHRADVVAMVEAFGGCLGAVTYPGPALAEALDLLFRLAADHGWALDFHADETIDPAVNTLALIAATATAHRFAHPVLVGHCCTLTRMADEERQRTIAAVAAAGLSIVSLPMCNMYLQDRDDPRRTPRWRGVTAIKELEAAGIPVMIASDNTRDPFYAYGDLDMVEVWREGTRIAHLDHPFGAWPTTVTTRPAAALGLGAGRPLRIGEPADLVVLPARSLSELMARPLQGRTVIRGGRPIDAEAPAYDRLDALEGLRP